MFSCCESLLIIISSSSLGVKVSVLLETTDVQTANSAQPLVPSGYFPYYFRKKFWRCSCFVGVLNLLWNFFFGQPELKIKPHFGHCFLSFITPSCFKFPAAQKHEWHRDFDLQLSKKVFFCFFFFFFFFLFFLLLFFFFFSFFYYYYCNFFFY